MRCTPKSEGEIMTSSPANLFESSQKMAVIHPRIPPKSTPLILRCGRKGFSLSKRFKSLIIWGDWPIRIKKYYITQLVHIFYSRGIFSIRWVLPRWVFRVFFRMKQIFNKSLHHITHQIESRDSKSSRTRTIFERKGAASYLCWCDNVRKWDLFMQF